MLEINSTGTRQDSWRAVPLMQRMGGDSIINLASIIAAVGDGRIFRACWADSIPIYRPRARPCGSPAIWPLPMPAKTFGSIASAQVMSNRTERSKSPATWKGTRPLQNVPDRQAWKTHEEIACAVPFLASDVPFLATGAPLMMDGGYTAQ